MCFQCFLSFLRLFPTLNINCATDRRHMMRDINYLRRGAGSMMAVAQPRQEKENEDCSLLPLVHDIIKW